MFFKTRLITNNAEQKPDANTPEFQFICRTETGNIHAVFKVNSSD